LVSSKLIIGSVAIALGVAILLLYPRTATPVGSQPSVQYLERVNYTYLVKQSFLLENTYNETVSQLVYVSVPINASTQWSRLTWSNWKPLRMSTDGDGNPILNYNITLPGGVRTWLNETFEVKVERYKLQIAGAPWPNLSVAESKTGSKMFWPVENKTYVSIAKEIAYNSPDPMAASSAIGRWILDRLNYTIMPRLGGEHALVLKNGKLVLRGDCQEVADVFVTLARALGIRARVAGGMLLFSHDETMWAISTPSGVETSDNWGGHAWPQIYVEPVGWVDIELLEGPSVKVGDFSESHVKYIFEEKTFTGSTLTSYCLSGLLDVQEMYFTFRVIPG